MNCYSAVLVMRKKFLKKMLKLMAWILVLLIIIGISAFGKSQGSAKFRRSGYESCSKPLPDRLNVHIVPHTHDDVGWLKTVDQYYYGSEAMIQKAGVQYILDSVIQELLKDPKRRFIYVESAFFFKWWHEQTPELQQKVKQLVNEGRLEFIGGAWSMNDEATTHYQSIIDQFAWGLRQLNDTFGSSGRPKIGWQIDTFGHSREMASIFAHMGYDGLFFGRLHYQDKRSRLDSKTGEMIWKASTNLGESSDLFTGALYNQYGPPPGFCFDILCSDPPVIDDQQSPDYNVPQRVENFIGFIKKQSQYYKTNNIILTMGGDFTYMDANVYYKNLDKLIRYTNENHSVNLFYSTPSCYLKALHDANQRWPIKTDDFFPYASEPHSFWTGYFTSRPTLKRFERVGNHFLQITKQLSATAIATRITGGYDFKLDLLRETMGIMQHHDAITGTERQKVAFDYAKRIDVAMSACSSVVNSIMKGMITGKQTSREKRFPLEFNNCPNLNISECNVSENSNQFMVTVYNALSHSTSQHIRIPVRGIKYQVMDYRNLPIESQLVPVPPSVKRLRFRSSNASNELVFLAADVPPLGFKSYYITAQSVQHEESEPEVMKVSDNPFIHAGIEPVTIGNKYINLTFDSSGLLSSVSSNGITRKVTQQFFYYNGSIVGFQGPKNRPSGAYIFHPRNAAHVVADHAYIRVFRGPAVEEVHQVFNEWISQVIRIYENENHVEFEWMVGPIPVEYNVGKEVITRFSSDIESQGVFFTDSNGREMIRRVRDKREAWNIDPLDRIAANYYPITTKIALQDNEARMAILVDRAQGGSSLLDGAIEIMVHRRLLHEDGYGVGEALNEVVFGRGLIARGQHYLILGTTISKSPSTQAQERFLQIQKLLPNWLYFSDMSQYPYKDWQTDFSDIKVGLKNSLPQNINLMTFEPWHQDEILIRFEHILEKNEDELYSKPFTFNLKDTLRDLKMETIRETTLDGNMWLDEMNRLKFKADDDEEVLKEIVKSQTERLELNNKDPFEITLIPMQIRTFIITLTKST